MMILIHLLTDLLFLGDATAISKLFSKSETSESTYSGIGLWPNNFLLILRTVLGFLPNDGWLQNNANERNDKKQNIE